MSEIKKVMHMETLVHLVAQSIEFPEDEVKKICECFVHEMQTCFQNETSLDLGDLPLLKVKKSVSHINDKSPRTPRNDRIIVTMKMNLNSKSNREGD